MAANRIHPSRIDFPRLCDAFLLEMRRGLEGRPSSLPMIPTYIETAREVPRGEKVIALDAGGTNLSVAVVSFDPAGKPVIEDLARHRMPGVDEELGREEFFRLMAGFVLPFAGRADRIGFCFSYAAEIMPDKDGKLLHFTKEIKARGVDGRADRRESPPRAGGGRRPGPPRIVLLNDTVATLLAGRNAAARAGDSTASSGLSAARD